MADRVQKGDTVLVQQALHMIEELRIVAHADMLEHADGDDTVELLVHVAIVAQFEPDPVGQAHFEGPLVRQFPLFCRQGDALYLDILERGEIQRHTAPAAADIEDLVAGFQVHLGGDQPLLVALRRLECVVRAFEKSAGILHVPVEEEFVELVSQIVMMRDILPRLADLVVLLEAPQPMRYCPDEALNRVGLQIIAVYGIEVEQVVEAAIFDGQARVHIRLTRGQLRFEKKAVFQRRVMKTKRDAGSRLSLEPVGFAVSVNYFQRADAHESLEQTRQRKHRPVLVLVLQAILFGAARSPTTRLD